uniref:Membrane-spanning 4-domains subfamily A member 8 n=1 Tax=Phallusia mammillata TaxID=59560 RepID=A0A6F9DLG0_9ASCI|nr:membrane-spanning 4-domains subfamily A member 8 [Phallusia mammillata]
MENWKLTQDQPQMILVHPIPAPEKTKKHMKIFKILGIIELVVGLISIVCGVIVASTPTGYYSVFVWGTNGAGVWCGVFFLVAGVLGVVSARKCEPCPVIGGMVMSIFSSLAGGVLVGLAIPAVMTIISLNPDYSGQEESISLICQVLMSICGCVALIVSITHSSYCCSATCCRYLQINGGSAYYTPVQVISPQVTGQLRHLLTTSTDHATA